MIFSKNHLVQVKKRDGRIVPFEENRILNAIAKAMGVTGEGTHDDAEKVSERVVAELNRKFPAEHLPTIEEIQDVVETELIVLDYAKTAKAYILYRNDRAAIRAKKQEVPDRVKALFDEKIFQEPARGVCIPPQLFAMDRSRGSARDMDRNRRTVRRLHERKSRQ
jgi:hypothetical protein